MKDFASLTAKEQIAQIKASEQRERDAKEARYQEGQRAMADVCAGCGRLWFTTRVAAGGSRPVWIPEARGKWHHACWQRFKETR